MSWIDYEHLAIISVLFLASSGLTIYGFFHYHPAIFIFCLASTCLFALAIWREVGFLSSSKDHEV